MGLRAKLKGIVGYKQYLNTLMLSAGLALLTLYIAFGLMYFATGDYLLPGPLVLLVFAICFVLSTVFYESSGRIKRKEKEKEKMKGKEGLKLLLKGLFLGGCATLVILALLGGLRLTLAGELPAGDWIISAFAICMIVNTIVLSLLRPSPVTETI